MYYAFVFRPPSSSKIKNSARGNPQGAVGLALLPTGSIHKRRSPVRSSSPGRGSADDEGYRLR